MPQTIAIIAPPTPPAGLVADRLIGQSRDGFFGDRDASPGAGLRPATPGGGLFGRLRETPAPAPRTTGTGARMNRAAAPDPR